MVLGDVAPMIRIFVEPAALVAGPLVIRGDEHHYVSRVRRAAVGDPVEVFDGAGNRARAQILAISDAETTIDISAVMAIPTPSPHIQILLPLIKGDRMDFALEKLVEVGVDEIIVWPAARSIVKLEPDRRDARIEKYALALQAASRQSGRPEVPTIAWADSLAAAIENVDGMKLVLYPGSRAPLASALEDARTEHGTWEHGLTSASGPEGGLTPSELSQLEAAGFTPVGLGPRVLRAETAPVAAVAIVRALTRS